MRSAWILLLLAGCAPVGPSNRVEDQARLAAEIGDRVPRGTINCLPAGRTLDQRPIGSDILFRDGSTLYLARTGGGCEALNDSGHVLLIRPVGAAQLCSGAILQVIESASGTFAGSCAIEQITEYRRP